MQEPEQGEEVAKLAQMYAKFYPNVTHYSEDDDDADGMYADGSMDRALKDALA